MDAKTLSADLLRAKRSWDAKLRQEIDKDTLPAAWRVIDLLQFSQSIGRQGLLIDLTADDFEFCREFTRFWGCHLEKIGAIEGFHVGEKVGPDSEDGCVVRIDSINDDQSVITLSVVEAPEGWINLGFTIGRTIEFKHVHFRKDTGYDSWTADDSVSVPWFILSIEADGRKTFEHYR